jgi:periplasmic protein TonB
MIGPNKAERLGSMLLTLSIHIGLGVALFSAVQTGMPPSSRNTGASDSALVVELIPLERLAQTGHAPARETTHQVTPSQIGKPAASAIAPPASESVERHAVALRSEGMSRDTRETESPVSAADLSSQEAVAWRARVQSHLARYRVYPAHAAMDGRQGIAQVQFTVSRNGAVSQAWIASSSGVSEIDRETIAAILRAQPLPVFPSGWPETLDVSLSVSFRLN